MKVKIIKNLSGNKRWDKYVDKVYEAEKNKYGNYIIKLNELYTRLIWLKDEVKEIK